MHTIVTDGLTFLCEDPFEAWRAQTLVTKEPGTIAWLNETLKPGDVFYDVGANIGCYTLYAARLVGAAGKVFAFEPHVGNAVSLLRNIRANGFIDRVRVLTVALHRQAGGFSDCLPFYYTSLRAGSSGHQLDHTTSEDGRSFTPAAVELKATATINGLISNGIITKPDVVKIDVDGNELAVLGGLCEFLTARHWPRALQVEIHAKDREEITELLGDAGYYLTNTHHTAAGERALYGAAKGVDPLSITHNAVFARRAA